MKRRLLTVVGCVQGVGFRPFVYRMALRYGLVGSVTNTRTGVDIDVQGSLQALRLFEKELVVSKPERAIISRVLSEDAPVHRKNTFEITPSKDSSETTLALLPDTGICRQCLDELYDPKNRRYRYPFIHCMTCGPRFSLFTKMPYDRAHTTMIDFSMCAECQREYENPSDRRFYSQTICCNTCGPKLRLLDAQQKEIALQNDAVSVAITALRQGKILAMKNTGGYLLLADATNEETLFRLRTSKRRPKKPFALLAPSLSWVKEVSVVSLMAEQVLTSYMAPIVLLKKNIYKRAHSDLVSFESPYHGIMLPHTPLQRLILDGVGLPLVATSGNMSGKPLCSTEEEAFSELSSIADLFLVHNRRIVHRLDDSVVQIIGDRPMLIRRARGYIPYAINLPVSFEPHSMLAVGGQQKNCFAFAKKTQLFISQHIGDLDTGETCSAYEKEIESWSELISLTPTMGACDIHPDYHSSHFIQKQAIATHAVQHHQAHVWSGMLDNQLTSPLLAFSWDGTGFGMDRTIWGGETFVVKENHMLRFASLSPFRLPGADKAIVEPRRSALGLLCAMREAQPLFDTWRASAFSDEEHKVLQNAMEKNIRSPLCSSMGRLFDAVSSLLGLCHLSSFEGEAALALEALALSSEKTCPVYHMPLVYEKDLWLMDPKPMLLHMIEDKMQGIRVQELALAFHYALVETMVAIAQKAGFERVLLTGGVMQNKLLVDIAIVRLKEAGFSPFWHQHIPPNDGGLAVGQIAGALFQKREKVCV